MAKKNTDSHVSFLNESELEEEKENLEIQKKLFEEQRANFWKERNAFTEAAIRLHKEVIYVVLIRTVFIKYATDIDMFFNGLNNFILVLIHTINSRVSIL